MGNNTTRSKSSFNMIKIKPGIFFFLKKSTLIASPDRYDKLSLIYKCTSTLNPIKKRSSDSVAPSSVTECLINSMQGISGLAIKCFLQAAMHCADLIWLRRTIMSILMPHIHATSLPTSGPATGQPSAERRSVSVHLQSGWQHMVDEGTTNNLPLADIQRLICFH